MHLRLNVDPEYEQSLVSHLAAQGFPATRTKRGELEVLFPGPAAIFAAAAELDLWEARCGTASSVVVSTRDRAVTA
jgi:hypothetical protein